jgi:hypothetical protein
VAEANVSEPISFPGTLASHFAVRLRFLQQGDVGDEDEDEDCDSMEPKLGFRI